MFETLSRRVLEYAAQRYGESREATRSTSDSARGLGHSRSFDTNDVARLVLIQITQHLVRKYLANWQRHHSNTSQDRHSHHHHSHHERGRQRCRRERDDHRHCRDPADSELQELLPSLDQLLFQLRSTEAFVENEIYRPATHEGCDFHRSVIANAGELQVSLARASMQTRVVRDRILQEQRGSHSGHGR